MSDQPCTCNRCPACGGLLPVPYYVPVPMPVWPSFTPWPSYPWPGTVPYLPIGPVWSGRTSTTCTTSGATATNVGGFGVGRP